LRASTDANEDGLCVHGPERAALVHAELQEAALEQSQRY
jgi:hypothetical protein